MTEVSLELFRSKMVEVEEKESVLRRGNIQARRLQRNTEDMLRYVLDNTEKQLQLRGTLIEEAKNAIDLLEKKSHLADIKIDKLTYQLNTVDSSSDLKLKDILEQKDLIISDLRAKLVSLETLSPRSSRENTRKEQKKREELLINLQNDNSKLQQEVESMQKVIQQLKGTNELIPIQGGSLEIDISPQQNQIQNQIQLAEIRNATQLNYVELQKLKDLIILIKNQTTKDNQQTKQSQQNEQNEQNDRNKNLQNNQNTQNKENNSSKDQISTLKLAYQKQVADLRKDNATLLKELSTAQGCIQDLLTKLDEADELLKLRESLLQVDDELAHTLRSFLNS